MPDPLTQVAVIIVAHNSRADLPDCLAGMDQWARGSVTVHTLIVDCASTDGTPDLIRQQFPHIQLLEPGENLGFAGGNNLAWDHIRQQLPQVKYVALLNPDTVPQPNWLNPLIDHLELSPPEAHVLRTWDPPATGIATCQPLITLHDQPDRINTAGNQSHYLGFGLITQFNQPIPNNLTPKPIGYSSGAACLIRADLLTKHGLFDPDMFLYCEDTFLGWKLTQLGYQHQLVPASQVAHKFNPAGSLKHYYYLERNRLSLLLIYYKRRTLLLLLPAILLMEVGQLLFALTHGKLRDKLRTWAYFLNRKNLKHIRQQRRTAQQNRTITDKNFTKHFTATLDHPTLKSPLVRYIANPILAAYWSLARRLIFW
jgi:GT2 family glycosyltransferase